MKTFIKNRWLLVWFIASMSLFALPSQAATISQDDPEKMVSTLSDVLVKEINLQRAELESSSEKVKLFADEYVLPYVDTAKMARYVMGKYWRTATEKQQSAFVSAFSNTLIRSYSKSLLKLKIESVSVKPAQSIKPGRVTVSSEVVQADGNKTAVVYRAYLNSKTNQWLLYDVAIEGISMLLNYRKAYGSDFSKKGIDAVIAEMEAKNTQSDEKV